MAPCAWPRNALVLGGVAHNCPAETARASLLCPVHKAIVDKPAAELSRGELAEIDLAFRSGLEWQQHAEYIRRETAELVAASNTRDRIARLYYRADVRGL
jgi:hypothetical protein